MRHQLRVLRHQAERRAGPQRRDCQAHELSGRRKKERPLGHRAVFRRQRPRGFRRPADAGAQEQHEHEDDPGPAVAAFRHRVEHELTALRRHRIRNRRPSEIGMGQHEIHPDPHADRQHDELDIIRDDHRDHAAEDRIHQHQDDQQRCDQVDRVLVAAAAAVPGDVRNERRPHLREQSHVEDAGQCADHPADNSYPAAVSFFEVLRDRQQVQFTQPVDDQPGAAEDDAHDCADHRHRDVREPHGERLHRRVHQRHQPESGADIGRHVQRRPRLAAADQVSADRVDIPVRNDPDYHRPQQVHPDDHPVDRREIS